MSLKEQQTGKFFMGGSNKIEVASNPILVAAEKLREEKEATEAKNLLLELEKEKQKEIEAKLEHLEMLPLMNKIILLPYPQNPYKKVLHGSIIVEYSGDFMNPDTGEKDRLKELIGCAKVIEVGPECKYLQAGDDVYYDTRTVYPVPFMSLGYVLCSEPQILCTLNENLKERFQSKK